MARPAKANKAMINSTREAKVKARTNGVVFVSDVPPPYGVLSDRENELYYLVAEKIKVTMPLMAVDVFVLQQLACSLAMAERALHGIREKGDIQVYEKTQARAVSPEVQLYEKAVAMITKLSALFAMSPQSRVSILGFLAPKVEKHDPAADL